jgi:glycosyltransferase involved in cell wall biosynthesis
VDGVVHVLTDSQRLTPQGGIEVATLQDVIALTERSHRVSVAYEQDGQFRSTYVSIGAALGGPFSFEFRPKRAPADLLSYLPAARWARRDKPDVLWLNRFEHILWAQTVAAMARCPIVCHLHHRPNYQRVRLLGTGVAHYIAVSEHMRRVWVDQGLPADKVSVVHNAVPVLTYPYGGVPEQVAARAALGLPVDRPVVLFYGLLVRDKGVDVLLRATRELPSDALVLLVGPSVDGRESEELDRELAGLGADRVRRFDAQSDVVPFLHAADVVAFPTRLDEAFGRVLVETLSTGRPIVASNIGAVPEVLTGGMAEFLVPPGDSSALAARLGEVLQWRTERPELGEQCAAWVRARFPFDRHVDGLETALAEAASR